MDAGSGATGVKDFNRALLDFIRDLAKSFPQVEGFRRAYASTNLMATLNPPLVQSMFNKVISPFVPRILMRDEAFFLAKDYTEEAAVAGENLEFVSMIKEIWGTMSCDDKDNIWRHMEVLVAINHTIG